MKTFLAYFSIFAVTAGNFLYERIGSNEIKPKYFK